MRVTEEEIRGLQFETAPLHTGDGYILSFDVYHQLHCLNTLRMALEPDYYHFKQRPVAARRHVGKKDRSPDDTFGHDRCGRR